MFDVTLSHGDWPFDLLDTGSIETFFGSLVAKGIRGGLVTGFEAVLNRDVARCNRLHIARMAKAPRGFIPVPTVNPLLHGWADTIEELGAQVVRLLPGYHGYELDSPEANDCGAWCTANRIPAIVQLRLEDERSLVPACRTRIVKPAEVQAFARRHPQVKMIALCPYLHEVAGLLADTTNLGVDTSFVDRLPSLDKLLAEAPEDKVFFGSHAPLFHAEGNLLKLTLSELPQATIRKIASENIARFLADTALGACIGRIVAPGG